MPDTESRRARHTGDDDIEVLHGNGVHENRLRVHGLNRRLEMQSDQPRRRIGMLTPSSNTVLEPMAMEILRGVPQVSVHFSRLRVTQISLDEAALQQFDIDAHLSAARLLADARVDVIGWNGTSASWTGFDGDARLCAEIERTHGVAATTAVLAINELLEIQEVRRFALVSPYIGDVQRRIIETYGRAGYECVAERRFEEQVNYAFAEIEDVRIAEAVRQVSTARPEAVVIMCTNLRSAHLAGALETELGIPILDSIAAFVWKAVRLCGIDTRAITGWGQLFALAGSLRTQAPRRCEG